MMQKHIVIQGKVQDVFFRAFVKENADRLGITGYALNVDDDKVEVLAQGESIDTLVELCKVGPPDANVKNVITSPVLCKEKFSEFTIRY